MLLQRPLMYTSFLPRAWARAQKFNIFTVIVCTFFLLDTTIPPHSIHQTPQSGSVPFSFPLYILTGNSLHHRRGGDLIADPIMAGPITDVPGQLLSLLLAANKILYPHFPSSVLLPEHRALFVWRSGDGRNEQNQGRKSISVTAALPQHLFHTRKHRSGSAVTGYIKSITVASCQLQSVLWESPSWCIMSNVCMSMANNHLHNFKVGTDSKKSSGSKKDNRQRIRL